MLLKPLLHSPQCSTVQEGLRFCQTCLSIHTSGPLTDVYGLFRQPHNFCLCSAMLRAEWPTCPAVELRRQLRQLPVAAALQLSVTARQLESRDQSLVLALGSDDLLEVRLPEGPEAEPCCMSAMLITLRT